jgi:hypothetical protein
MVKVSGVPYDVELPNKDSFNALADKMFDCGYSTALDLAVAYLEHMHQQHKEMHNYYRVAAENLKLKLKK